MDAQLRMEQIVKLGTSGRTILDIDSFKVNQGEYVCICGNQGAGKTTMARILCGLETASSGTVYLNDKDLGKCTEQMRTELRNEEMLYLGAFPKTCEEFTLEEQLVASYCNRFPKNCHGEEVHRVVTEFMEQWNLKRYAHYRNKHLSLLQKSQAMLAFQLIREPKVLLLDDCMMGMKPVEVQSLEAMLKKAIIDKTVIWFGEAIPQFMEFQSYYTFSNRGLCTGRLGEEER